MTHSPQNEVSATMPDGISCVGFLLMAVLLLSTLGVGLSRSETVSSGDLQPVVTVTGTTAVLAQVSATATLPPTPVWTPTRSATVTATASATATVTPLPTHTETATSRPSATPLPATLTATPLPVTATPTQPPLLPTPNGHFSYTLRVPILMYHYISTPPEDADIYRIDLSVEPAIFRAQMEYLALNGYSTIDFYDLSLAITGKKELPPNPVIITVDDGYRDAYDNAFPILQELGLTATVFIVTEFVDQNHPTYMNWAMIEEMAAAGIRMEPHTKTHVDLRERDRNFLIYQILGSQETLAAHIGYTPRYFAYPGGRYDDEVIAVLADLNFWGAVTTAGGKWHGFEDRYEWTRMRVRYTTTLAEFADLVR